MRSALTASLTCLLAGLAAGASALQSAPAQAQSTCDMGSPDFNECMQRRCTELQGRGRLCSGYYTPQPQTQPNPQAPNGDFAGGYYRSRPVVPPATVYAPGAYGGYGYSGYVPLDPNGTILVRPSRIYTAPGYGYVQPYRPVPPVRSNTGGPTGVCYMGLC
jgi:hypothetical protein